VLLSRQREIMAGALNRRLSKMTSKAADLRGRIEDGAAAEDETQDDETGDRAAR